MVIKYDPALRLEVKWRRVQNFQTSTMRLLIPHFGAQCNRSALEVILSYDSLPSYTISPLPICQPAKSTTKERSGSQRAVLVSDIHKTDEATSPPTSPRQD
ncbi:hypothetical protein CEXT_711371 [Caerostris extrusa]|uniref:Uncharacterized protein n=1 Tax=Caerostris extrusa TaxID=172846 RepID=A0AAV4Y1I9_CAEEX|nr:hypothetical protein CEXT_711371 [Caerostris extrusa]